MSCSKAMVIAKNSKSIWPSILVCLVISHTLKYHQKNWPNNNDNDQNNYSNKTLWTEIFFCFIVWTITSNFFWHIQIHKITVIIIMQGIESFDRQADCRIVFHHQEVAICFNTIFTTLSLILTIGICLNSVTTKYDEYKNDFY